MRPETLTSHQPPLFRSADRWRNRRGLVFGSHVRAQLARFEAGRVDVEDLVDDVAGSLGRRPVVTS